MAKSGRIRRIIELILDPNASRKAERDTQDALRRATDTKAANRNLQRFGTFVASVGRQIATAAAAVGGYIVALTKLGERGAQVLAVQRAFTAVVGDAESALVKLRKATGGLISDYDLMVNANKAFSLGVATSTEELGELVSVAQDLGRAMGVDASQAMEALLLGIGRQSKQRLDDLGILVDGVITLDKVMAQARIRVQELGGTVSTAGDMILRFKTNLSNLKDEIAKFVANNKSLRIAFFEAGNFLETLVLAFKSGDQEEIKQAFTTLGKLAGYYFAGAFLDVFAATMGKISSTITPDVMEKRGMVWALDFFNSLRRIAEDDASEAREAVEGLLKDLAEQRKKLEDLLAGRGGGGTGPPPRVPPPDLEAEDARLKLLMAGHELAILTKSEWAEIASIYEQANKALQSGNLLLEERIRQEGRLKATSAALLSARVAGMGVPGRDASGILAGFGTSIKLPAWDQIRARTEVELSSLTEFALNNWDSIAAGAELAALSIEDSFRSTFDILFSEGADLEHLFGNVFKGMAASAIGAIAEMATHKVAEQIALAVEMSARGLGDLARGSPHTAAIWFKSAKTHVLSAAKYAALGGAAASAASAISGGGGGGSDFRGSDVTGRAVDRLDQAVPNVTVIVDGIDPDNPKHIQLVQRTVINARQQWGDQKPSSRRYSRSLG